MAEAVTFELRAARDQLVSDLRDSENKVLQAVDRIKKRVEGNWSEPIAPKIDVDSTDATAVVKQLDKDLDDVANKPVEVRPDVDIRDAEAHIQQLKEDLDDVQKKAAGLPAKGKGFDTGERIDLGEDKPAGAIGGGLERAAEKGLHLQRSLSAIAKAATVVEATIKGIELASSAWELTSAAISGNYEKQVKAAKDAEDTIKGIPIIGDKILALGKTINKYTLDLVTHEQEYVEKIQKATAEQEKHIATMAKQAKAQQDNIAAAKAAINAVGATDNPNINEEDRYMQKRKEEAKAIKDALMGPGMRDKGDKLTATGQNLQAQATKRMNNEDAAFWQQRNERAMQSVAKYGETMLRMNDRVAEADRAAFIQTLRDKETAAAKVSADELDRVRTLNQADLALYDKQKARERQDFINNLKFSQDQAKRRMNRDDFGASQEAIKKQYDDQMKYETDLGKKKELEATRDAELAANAANERRRLEEVTAASVAKIWEGHLRAAGNDYEADVAAFAAAADAKIRAATTLEEKRRAELEKTYGLEDMKVQRQKKTDDLVFQTSQMHLKRMGEAEKAAVNDIKYEIEDQLEANAGDPAMQEAIMASAKERLASITDDRGSFQAIQNPNLTDMTHRLTGSDLNRPLDKIQKDALSELKKIAINTSKSQPARTTP